MTAQNNAGTTADQATQSDQNQNQNQSDQAEQLPETASPLPLLGLLGFGSLAAGWFARRK
jgi:LPXTG-motif cell wall-anchored protein